MKYQIQRTIDELREQLQIQKSLKMPNDDLIKWYEERIRMYEEQLNNLDNNTN